MTKVAEIGNLPGGLEQLQNVEWGNKTKSTLPAALKAKVRIIGKQYGLSDETTKKTFLAAVRRTAKEELARRNREGAAESQAPKDTAAAERGGSDRSAKDGHKQPSLDDVRFTVADSGGTSNRNNLNSGNLLDSLYTSDGEINYEQVQNAVDGIVSGVYRIIRLTPEGERGRIKGSRLLVGSSLIVGGENSPNEAGGSQKKRNKQEELLEAYAKNQNAWIDDIEAFRNGLGQRIGRGAEAVAYEDPKDPNFVIKIAPIPHIIGSDSSILDFFDNPKLTQPFYSAGRPIPNLVSDPKKQCCAKQA